MPTLCTDVSFGHFYNHILLHEYISMSQHFRMDSQILTQMAAIDFQSEVPVWYHAEAYLILFIDCSWKVC